MKVLVTGASGFLGQPIVQRLAEKGYKVMAFSRNPPNGELTHPCHWVKSDLSVPSTFLKAVQSFAPEVLIHLAWEGIPDFSFEKSRKNLVQSLGLLASVISVGSCRKILVAGSCLELNRLKGECLDFQSGMPKDHFTWAKHSIRSWLEMMCAKQEIGLGWLRLFYVYGPRQRSASLIPNILSHLKTGTLPLLRTPKNANDFVFVDDVADAFSLAAGHEFPSGIYNLGSGVSTPVLEVCRHAERAVCGSDLLTSRLELQARDVLSEVNFWSNTARATEHLGWSPKTSLSEGIERTWHYMNAL